VVDGILGNRAVAGIASSLIDGTRVLGLHGVEDLDCVLEGLDWIRARFQPVSVSEIAVSVETGVPLPDGVCITFDDGDPSVLDLAMPLTEMGFQAAMFVCPGVIDTTTPYWWELIRRGARHSLRVEGIQLDQDSVESDLKSWPDEQRRAFIDSTRQALIARGISVEARQLTKAELLQWSGIGHEVGNHTWDHPMLDTCSDAEQERQIRSAHHWFVRESVPTVPVFAYPNGNATERSNEILRSLGYKCGFLFDHRVARADERRFEISRIRANADSRSARFRASVSGLHPQVVAVRERLA